MKSDEAAAAGDGNGVLLSATRPRDADSAAMAMVGRATAGISPVSMTLAFSDWWLHLLLAPGKRGDKPRDELTNFSTGVKLTSDASSYPAEAFLIEHQTRVVFSICDEVTVLSAGDVIATGPAADVFHDERVREVYLGL